MAHDAGDRTEAPTPRRRQEAREKGQIARSTDMASAVLLLGGLLILRWFGPGMLAVLYKFMQSQINETASGLSAGLDPSKTYAAVGMTFLIAMGPLLLGLVVLALISNLWQTGFLWTTEPLTPNITRLNPLSGFHRMFSLRTFVQMLMNVAKLALLSLVAYSAVSNRSGRILTALDLGGWPQAGLMAEICYEVGIRLALALILIGIADYIWQRWRHEKDLRMTKEEVREELRRMEGDPVIKQRRRKMQFAAVMQQIRKNVPKADVVVTNPTEFAVAIKYDSTEMSAPKVVAKGRDLIAQKIREIAEAHGIPVLERKPLARALYKLVEVGQEIPESLYKAMAEVLAYVYQLAHGSRGVSNGEPASSRSSS